MLIIYKKSRRHRIIGCTFLLLKINKFSTNDGASFFESELNLFRKSLFYSTHLPSPRLGKAGPLIFKNNPTADGYF